MEVKVTSVDLVKPSSPTPLGLRTFKLSLLDQLIPMPYATTIFFYRPGCSIIRPRPHETLRERLDLLKVSLSRTLCCFYPLAGRIRDGLFIDCDDGGVYYVEADVNVPLPQFLEKPDLVLLRRLLPCDGSPVESSEDDTHTANIQVNVFPCGGIAIGLCISHMILDGVGLGGFMKEWAAEARGGTRAAPPPGLMATAADLLPADNLSLKGPSMVMWGSLFKIGKWITRRFVFDRSAIDSLRARGTGPNNKNPTRVEAISGFLWKCAVAAASKRRKNDNGRPSFCVHMVNIRGRMDPPSPEVSLGNFLWMASTKLKKVDPEQIDVLPSLVSELREAISSTDAQFLSRLRRDKEMMLGCFKEISSRMEPKEGADYFGFSSWCKFGHYEVDFGWGKPAWVSCVGLNEQAMLSNLVILIDTRSGDGIEAWVTLDEHDMALLKVDPEMQAFSSYDPNPLAMS
ncbi:hypothetical protein SAY86_016566 [Trapa natans]|uniref:Uncharacterized protein n=1 Tax=Trapa natans TaxID=22666 RepID=A0AAN7QWF4_TRANT|nr:hypothetical protein SAY86_016566 [Trapa natans]